MNLNWETIKAYAKAAYIVLAQVFVFQLLSFYLLGCLVAVTPLGPRAYVDFVDYCFHWRPGANSQPSARTTR